MFAKSAVRFAILVACYDTQYTIHCVAAVQCSNHIGGSARLIVMLDFAVHCTVLGNGQTTTQFLWDRINRISSSAL